MAHGASIVGPHVVAVKRSDGRWIDGDVATVKLSDTVRRVHGGCAAKPTGGRPAPACGPYDAQECG